MNRNGGFDQSAAAAVAAGGGDADAEALRGLLEDVRAAERHLARAVLTAGRLAGTGACERIEGLPLELLLALAARMTGADRRMLVAAGEVLADMPATARLFANGQLSWGQIRAVTAAVRRLGADGRAHLDARVAATAERFHGVDAYDPDQFLWAVDHAVDELRDQRAVERAETRRRHASFVAVQAGLDGGVKLYAELDAARGAPVLNALDAAAAQPTSHDHDRDGDDRDGDGGDDDARPDGTWPSTSRARQYADALERVCADWLAGDTDRPARPLLVAHVDLSQLHQRPHGTVELAVRGDLPRVTAATLEALAASADVRAVVFDGARPLAATGKTRADAIPAATRLAVRARDLACRFPGSTDPLAHTDLHHLTHREHGGDHHPDNLIALSRRHHTAVHRHDWKLRIDGDTGIVHAKRRHRHWRSLPRGTPLAEPSDDPTPPH